MPSVRRKDFIETRLDRQIDLNAAKNDPAFRAKLQAAGFKLEDLDKLDLYSHDGVLRGPRELRALFDLLKGMDGGGPADALTVGGAGPTWAANRAGKALEAFDTQFETAPRPPPPPGSIADPARLVRVPLSGAVGAGGANRHDDVLAVQQRLREIGFDITPDGQSGPKTENALRVYRAMLTGTDECTELEGRVEPGDLVHATLALDSPPRWVAIPRSGPGFVNEDYDGFGYGSAEAVAAIEEAGAAYARNWQASHPGAAPLSVNDVSPRNGGKNRDHQSHQNGLDVDLRLPKGDGTSGSTVSSREYDREATWAMLAALGASNRVERLLLSDPVLLRRAASSGEPWAYKLFDGGPVHKNHIHVDVKPPGGLGY